MATLYATVEELKEYVGEGTVETRYENLFESSLDGASRAIETYCDRIFSKEDTTASPSATAKTFHAHARYRVFAEDFYSATGLVVKVDDDDDGTYETTLTITTDYLTGPTERRVGEPDYLIDLVGTRTWPRSRRPGVEVTALWGWADIPPEVHLATMELAAEKFKRKDAPFGVVGIDEFGPIRISRSDMRVLSNIPDRLRRHPVLVG